MNLEIDNFIVYVIAIGIVGSWAESVLLMEKTLDTADINLSRIIRDITAENGSGTDETDSILKKNTDIHVFSNDSNPSISMIWSGSQGVILALTTSKMSFSHSRLYRSINYGRSFTDISSQIQHDRILASHGMLVSPLDSEHVLLVKNVISFVQYSVLHVSTDSGKTFDRVDLKFNIKPGSITFNPVQSAKLLATSEQHNALYISYDFALAWKHVSNDVAQVKWDPMQSNTFYYTKDPTGRLIKGSFTNELYRCDANNLKCTKIAEHVFSFGIQGGFLFISVEYLIHNGGRVMHVSKDGGNTWDAAQIPMINEKQFYSILDMSEQMVFVHVDNVEGKGDGTVYTSGSKGIIYSKSLNNHLYPNMGSITDFYKVSSLKGVYITSQLQHGEDTIHSMITFDKGGTWQKIDPPKGSVCAKSEKECQLQIHSLFSKSKGVALPEYPKSTESAVGIILAHANIGDGLNFNPPDVYVSNDGGYTWLQPSDLKGAHYYAIGDSGGLLYAVSYGSLTNKLKYSVDEGETWEEYTFIDHPIKVTGLSVEPGSRSTVVGLWGWDEKGDGAWRSVTVDFGGIMRPCDKQDYVKWKAHEGNAIYAGEDKCLLGADVIFKRKKKGSKCQNGKNFVSPTEVNPCKCFKSDYFCDYGYKRNGQDCIHDDAVQDSHLDICVHGMEERIDTAGYRKIPGDKCQGGFVPNFDVVSLHKSCIQAEEKKEEFGVDRSHFSEDIPPSHTPETPSHTNVGLVVFLVIVILGLGTTLVLLIRKRHFSGKRVKYVPLSTSEHLTNDDTVGASTSLLDDSDSNSNGSHYSSSRRGSQQYGADIEQGNVAISYHDDSDEDMLIS